LLGKIRPDEDHPSDEDLSLGNPGGGVRRLWRDHSRGRQRSMAGFSLQPEGTGRIFPAALSLAAGIHPVFVATRFAHPKKSAPVAARPDSVNRPWHQHTGQVLNNPRACAQKAPRPGRGRGCIRDCQYVSARAQRKHRARCASCSSSLRCSRAHS
jgi:hypothetical protein